MKKLIHILTVLSLLFACTPENNNNGGGGGKCPAGAVDLGIVMTREDGTNYRLFWAKSNLSESGLCANEEDYGDYYAWGETEPYYVEGHSQESPCTRWREKTGYNWESYKWCYGTKQTIAKYCNQKSYGIVDNLRELQRREKSGETIDDAACAKLGGKWRMPTNVEWDALRAQCTWKWISDYKGTGIAGRIVTSNVDGYKDKSIFIPAAGYRSDRWLNDVETHGEYWSSSLNSDYPYRAWGVNFNYAIFYRYSSERSIGRSIRPVYEE